jgi:hypothetical protein
VAVLAFALSVLSPVAVTAGAQGIYWVYSCSGYHNSAPVFTGRPGGTNWVTADECGAGRDLEINVASAQSGVTRGHTSEWSAVTPTPALQIVSVDTPSPTPTGDIDNPVVECDLQSDGFRASYFWGNDGTNYGMKEITVDCHGGIGFENYPEAPIDQSITPSRYFGWQVTCQTLSVCKPHGGLPDGGVFGIQAIALEVAESSGPALAPSQPNDLYNQPGWVRGTFPAGFVASDPSGICAAQTQVNGTALTDYTDPTPDTSTWTQCPGSYALPGTVSTAGYPNGAGAIQLLYWARNAAGMVTTLTRSVNVDNVTPAVSLSGPGQALSTAGTQYVTANATAGPSGVAGIFCAVDGGSFVEYRSSQAQIPVSGVGRHQVSCYVQNNAVDSAGQPATSPTQSFYLDIQQPSAAAISFTKVIDGLRCHRVTRTIRVPGQWVVERAGGRRIRVRIRAHRERVHVRRCHARVVVRRVRVGRHYRRERLVILPRTVSAGTKRVGFGRTVTVHGWLGTTEGDALAGQTVQVLTAPANGSESFSTAAVVVTAPDGTWTARLPAGPSRLVEVSYAGSSTVAATTSRPVRLTVRGSLSLHVAPRRTRWGSTIRISGRLRGGYVPPAGELVVLRIGYRGGTAQIGQVYAHADGRFSLRYTFLRGVGHERYRIWAVSARESDYPFAPGRSRDVTIAVS